MLNETRLRTALLGSGAAVALLASPAVADEVDDLKAQIEALQSRLDQVEVQQNRLETERIAPAQAVVGGDFPGSWKLPGTDTSIAFSGYTKLDTFFDIDNDVGDSFAATAIALDNTAGDHVDGNFRMHARQSRFRFDSRTPTDWGQMRTRIEGDFFGGGGNERYSNSTSFRLRHAWGRLGPVLVGQSWTTFQDEDTFADTVDFAGPTAVAFARQAQIRYTAGLGEGLSADVAIENPEMRNRTATSANNASVVDQLPDFVGALRYRAPWGAINVSAVIRQFNFDNGQVQDDVWGYGVHVGANVKVFGNDTLSGVFNTGEGIGRYLGGAVAGVTVSCATAPGTFVATCKPDLETQSAWGAWGGYTHHWNDSMRSNLYYGHVQNEVNVGELGAAASQGQNNTVDTLHANIWWSPVSRVNIGLEFAHGWRETVAEGSGEASRIILGMQYVF